MPPHYSQFNTYHSMAAPPIWQPPMPTQQWPVDTWEKPAVLPQKWPDVREGENMRDIERESSSSKDSLCHRDRERDSRDRDRDKRKSSKNKKEKEKVEEEEKTLDLDTRYG